MGLATLRSRPAASETRMQRRLLNVRPLALGAILAMGALHAASATTFDFSYTFSSTGKSVTGSFDGTASGDFITGLSNISVSYDGTALSGPLYAYRYDLGWIAGEAVVSFDRHKNEFAFTNCDQFMCAGGVPADYNYLIMRHSNVNQNATTYKVGLFNVDDGYPNDSWAVTARAPVPEPAVHALLAAGLGALALYSRRRRTA